MSEFDKPIRGRASRFNEDTRRVKEIKRQLEKLTIHEKLHIISDNEFYNYCGFDALRTLKSFGNTVISLEMVGKEGVESAEKAFEEILGVPVTISLLPSTGAGDREAYKVEIESRQEVGELPDPLHINCRLGLDGRYKLSLDKTKDKKIKPNYYQKKSESLELSLRDDFD